MIISRVFHKNQVIPERPHIPMGQRKVVNWSWVILVGEQFFKNQWQKYSATWGIQCPLAEINGKINKWIAWWKGTGEQKPAERLWRRPLINELSAQRKFKKFCCGKCSSLAVLIKVGGLSGINYISLTEGIRGIAKRSGTDQHGLPLQTRKLQKKLIFFSLPIDM